jgi:hypothetical protein
MSRLSACFAAAILVGCASHRRVAVSHDPIVSSEARVTREAPSGVRPDTERAVDDAAESGEQVVGALAAASAVVDAVSEGEPSRATIRDESRARETATSGSQGNRVIEISAPDRKTP